MISRELTLRIPTDMDSHPAALIVQLACQFSSNVYVEVGDKKVNAKSIMGMMSLKLDQGDQVIISANGDDETEAVQKIEEYLTSGK